MANHEIATPKRFSMELRKFETTDRAHANVFNAVINSLINNDAFLDEVLNSHFGNRSNPHGVTKAQIGLGNADNTPDAGKPVSAAQEAAINVAKQEAVSAAKQQAAEYTDANYRQATGYADAKIAQLIGAAPATLDTLGEIAAAMKNNPSVISALESAIGTKLPKAEFDSHVAALPQAAKTGNYADLAGKPTKLSQFQNDAGFLPSTGNGSNLTAAFAAAAARGNLASGEKLSVSLGKLAKWFADLKAVAWSGNYSDLAGRPAIQNNLTTATAGSALDAVQGKLLNDTTVKKSQLSFDPATRTLTITL